MAHNFKSFAQALLKRTGLYQRVKASCLYDFYWAVADRQLLADRAAELKFYQTTLAGFKPGSLVFDVGANQGYKTDVFLRLGARVVAVDPDAANQVLLRQKFLQYRCFPKPVWIEPLAVSDQIGITTFWMDAPGSAKNTLNPKWVDTLRRDETRFGRPLDFAGKMEVPTTTLDRLMDIHGAPFYIKIDVEGHEPSVLRGLKRPVPFLSFEVNLPEFRPEGAQCLATLGELCPDGRFNFATDARRGLRCDPWLPQWEFAAVFEQCQEPAIEVYWRTPPGR